jgi:hypothetical protein
MSDVVKEAKEAINAVFSDTSVEATVTMDRLNELAEEISSCKEALEEL